jgi:hypothetical protein
MARIGFSIQDEPNDDVSTTRTCEEDYGIMNLPDIPDDDDVNYGVMDKYLNDEL